MATINVDLKIFADVRFKIMAEELKIDLDAVYGKCFRIWAFCIEVEKADVSEVEIDTSAGLRGFAKSMMKAGLVRSSENAVDLFYVKGTKARIAEKSEVRSKLAVGGKNRVKSATRDHSGRFKPVKADETPAIPGEKSPNQLFIAHYCEEFKALYKCNPPMDGKASGLAKTIVKDLGLENAKKLVTTYFRMGRGDFTLKHHDLGTFKLNLNAIKVQQETGRSVSRDDSRRIERATGNAATVSRVFKSEGGNTA